MTIFVTQEQGNETEEKTLSGPEADPQEIPPEPAALPRAPAAQSFQQSYTQGGSVARSVGPLEFDARESQC